VSKKYLPNQKLDFVKLMPAAQELKPALSFIRLRLPNGCILELPSDLPTNQVRALFTMVGVSVC
jgi:hypothetical protein